MSHWAAFRTGVSVSISVCTRMCAHFPLLSVCGWFREGLLYASALLLHWDCRNFQVH